MCQAKIIIKIIFLVEDEESGKKLVFSCYMIDFSPVGAGKLGFLAHDDFGLRMSNSEELQLYFIRA